MANPFPNPPQVSNSSKLPHNEHMQSDLRKLRLLRPLMRALGGLTVLRNMLHSFDDQVLQAQRSRKVL